MAMAIPRQAGGGSGPCWIEALARMTPLAARLYLIDAHSLIYQVFHAVPPMTSPKGQPTNAVFGFVGDVLRLYAKQPDYLICVFDPPGKTFRDDLYPEYKAHREPMPDDLRLQLPLLRQALEAMRIPIIEIPGFEADDAIATIARAADRQGIEVFICSSDKDLRQLITNRTKLYNVRKDLVMDEAALLADWGVKPDQVIDLLTLTGDAVDNVPGVPGVGVKTAAKLLNEHGSLERLAAALPGLKKGKLKDNLIAHQEQWPRSKELVALKEDVPLEMRWEEWRRKPVDVPAFLAVCQECGFHRHAQEVRRLAQAEGWSGADAAASTAPVTGSARSRPQRQEAPSLFDAPTPTEVPLQPPSLPGDMWQARYQLVDTPAKFSAFLTQLRQQRRFAIDLETTSLDAHQAEIVGIAICWQAGEGYYLALRGPEGQPTLHPEEALTMLRPLLEDPAIAKVNQNIKYDWMVFKAAGVDLQGVAGDSMIASYLLNAGERQHNLDDLSIRYLNHQPIAIETLIGKGKTARRMDEVDTAQVAEYAAEDADVAWRLCERLEPDLAEQQLTELYREVEIPLIRVLGEMEWLGIRLDVPLLQQLSQEFAEQIEKLQDQIHHLAGHPFNIDSPKQLRTVLFEEMGLPKQRKTAVSGDASTAQEVLEDLAAAGHELPRLIMAYRQLVKLKGTYVDALPEMVNPKTGRLHCSFNQAVAATGRLSCSDPNLQNIPMRTEQGQQIRKAFIPGAPDQVLLMADYSQIELRVLAHCSEDAALIQAFAEDQDIHNLVAAQIFGVAVDQVTPAQRRMAKTVNFGVIYGLSAFGLAKRLGMSQEEAAAFIDAYFARYPGVADFQEKTLDETREKGYVTTILGRRRSIQGVRPRSSHRHRNQPEREALNTVIQGSAADLMKKAMLHVERRLRQEQLPAAMLLQIHDELVLEVRQDAAATVARMVEQEMQTALALRVPLKVDLAAGPNWLEGSPL